MAKRWTDLRLATKEALFDDVQSENLSQLDKWGVQTHDPFEWLAYTTEELGELSEAISEWMYRTGTPMAIYIEAIQVATLALKIAEMARGEMHDV
jgi:hypothetical protein